MYFLSLLVWNIVCLELHEQGGGVSIGWHWVPVVCLSWCVCLGDTINLYWEGLWETFSWDSPCTPCVDVVSDRGGVSLWDMRVTTDISAEAFVWSVFTDWLSFSSDSLAFIMRTQCPEPGKLSPLTEGIRSSESRIAPFRQMDMWEIKVWFHNSLLLPCFALSFPCPQCHQTAHPPSKYTGLMQQDGEQLASPKDAMLSRFHHRA